MFLTRLFRWLCGGKESPTSSRSASNAGHGLSSHKSYAERKAETEAMSTDDIRAMIAQCEKDGKDCGVAYGVLAERSNTRAKTLKIDPPRPGRKTYGERYAETSAMSTSDIKAMIAQRETDGKECGVLYKVLADRT